MEIRQPLTIDLARQLPVLPVSAVQGDGNTRVLAVTLLENGAPWQIPEAAVVDVAFRKPDGTKGIYSKLPDGSDAAIWEGNVLHATLAPQMLTCPGSVLATVVFRTDGNKTLAAFPFTINVASNPAAGAQISEDYFNPTDISELRAELAAGLATKAPAGFGLGDTSQAAFIATVAELDNFKLNGNFVLNQSAGTLSLEGVAFNMMGLKVKMSGPAHGEQIVLFTQGWTIRRILDADVWQPWEWVNPPMALGVEYRTTERLDGKAVYTKLIDFGAFNGNSYKEFTIGTTEAMNIPFRWRGFATKPDGVNYQIPSVAVNADMYLYAYNGADYIYMAINANSLGDISLNGQLQIWYTKD